MITHLLVSIAGLTLAQTNPAELDQVSKQLDSVRSAVDRLAAALPMWFDIALGFAALWGIFLWLFGRRVVRPSITFIALTAGAIVGGLAGRQMGDNSAVIVAVIVGGIGAAVLVWATFRLWVAVLLAVMLAAATPWAVLAWQGEPMPTAHRPLTDAVRGAADDARGGFLPDRGIFSRPDGEPTDDGASPTDTDTGTGEHLADRFAGAAEETWAGLRTWWADDLSGGTRWLILAGAGVMAVTGFLIGLIFPNLAAAIAAALVGSSLMIAAVLRLSAAYAPGLHDRLPATPRGVLVTLVGLTIIGALIQWTILGRRADN